MTNAKLFSEIATLPATLKAEVVRTANYGCAKGLIKMSPDFDEPVYYSWRSHTLLRFLKRSLPVSIRKKIDGNCY
jgi:hypothetical protein